MATEYDDIDELLLDLDDDIYSVVENEMSQDVSYVYNQKSVDMYKLYGNHEPNRKDKGIPGGFYDPANIVPIVLLDRDKIELTVSNETEARGFDVGDFLDAIIEEGFYEYWYQMDKGAPPPPPRPVSKWVMEVLEEQQIIEQDIKDGLQYRGWEIN